MSAPFSVLHVCLGNICRSPMAERLLAARFAARLAQLDPTAEPAALLRSSSVGTGDWHVGQPMNAGSATQLAARGVSAAEFAARSLGQVKLAEADLILTATASQQQHIGLIGPEAAPRTFPLLRFGRLARTALQTVPPTAIGALTASTVRHRGQALMATVLQTAPPRPGVSDDDDDLTDPYGHDDETFAQVADEIERALAPLVTALVGDRV